MKIRNLSFFVTVLFTSSLLIFSVVASADDTSSLATKVMGGSSQNQTVGSLKKEVQITNAEKKKGEVQIDLGNSLKAYISEGESPYGKDLSGKPLRGAYRTTFGFHVPL